MSPEQHLAGSTPVISHDLLRTKLTPPQAGVGTALVRREALLKQLDAALHARLTLVSAPAGFGKTTLVSEWINRDFRSFGFAQDEFQISDFGRQINPKSEIANLKFAWLSLDADDNDPVRFWRYVITACQTFDAELGVGALTLLRATPRAEIEEALNVFLNDLALLDGTCAFVLVLEDYHAITSTQIHELMDYWLDHLPAALHLILLTRQDPPLPLARLRARDQLRELRADDLRFTRDEAEAFARQTLARLGESISPETVARFDERLEGWPAGWRMLALLAERQRDSVDIERLIADFDGAHQHVTEYFVGEVLAAQPIELQDFLLRTAWLNRLNASLCDVITGRTDSAALLDQLERSNLFLQRLNTEHGETWYRYHSLFAEAMRHVARRRLGEHELRNLAARASAWHEAQGNLPEAIETAFAADEPERAAVLIEQFVERGLYEELYSQRRWLERLPQAVLFAQPALCLAYASAVLFTEDRHAPATHARIEPYLAQAEKAWRADGSSERLGELLAFRAAAAFWQGDLVANSALAREALALLPEHNALWRGVSLLQVVGEEIRAGRLAELPALAMETRALCAASGNLPAALAALAVLGETSYWRGEFRQAALYFEQTLEEARMPRLNSDRQIALTQLALLAFEQNEIERADRLSRQAIDLGAQPDEPDWLKRAVLMRVRVQHARGEVAQAREDLHQFIAAEKSPAMIREAQLLQARLALLDGDVTRAQRVLANLPSFGPKLRLDEEIEALLRARVLLAQHKPNDALRLVREWREDAHANERARCEMEWAMIESLVYAHATRDDMPHARLALADALTIAQREEIIRPFIEAGIGMPLAVLLRESLPHWRGAEIELFARELLALIVGEEPADAASEWPELTEPLSAQERRVLRLLAAGMTNAEIARELTVSVNTVKTQTQSIYRKLNVNNRDEARDVARRMKLI